MATTQWDPEREDEEEGIQRIGEQASRIAAKEGVSFVEAVDRLERRSKDRLGRVPTDEQA